MNTTELKNIFLEENKRTFIFSEDKKYTYSDFLLIANDIQSLLIENNIQQNDNVAVCCENRLYALASYIACIFMGTNFIPISKDNLNFPYILEVTNPKFIIRDEEIKNIPYKRKALITEHSELSGGIFFTSGTEGKPKGVYHTTNKMLNNAVCFNLAAGLDKNTNMIHAMPVHYMAGILNSFLCPLLARSSITLLPKFSPSLAMDFWKLPIKYHANAAWLSPTMLHLLTKMTRDKTCIEFVHKYLKNIFIGTAPLPDKVKVTFEKKFHTICFESYGMTETMLLTLNKNLIAKETGDVGCPIEGVNIKIEDKKILVRTEHMMSGYYSGENFDNNNFFDTGDLGKIIDKNLIIEGRSKDVIIRGGLNISPKAIENFFLAKVSNIQDVVVCSEDNEVYGQVPILYIETNQENNISSLKEEVLKISQELSPEYRPNDFIFLAEFPRTVTGKVIKSKISNGRIKI